jgi:hypothetical protein
MLICSESLRLSAHHSRFFASLRMTTLYEAASVVFFNWPQAA